MPIPRECEFRPTTEDMDAFNARKKTLSLGISGSGWGLKQLQHCHIDCRSELEAIQLLKVQNLVPENSIIAGYLRQNLSNDWQRILRSCAADDAQQRLSSLDHGLGKLASLPWSEHSYHSSSSLELLSSPPLSQSHFNTSPGQQRKVQRAAEYAQKPTRSPDSSMSISPLTLPLSPLAEYSSFNLSPAQRQGEGVVSVFQQSPPPSSPPEMTTPFTDMSSPPRFALSKRPGDLGMLSDSAASSEMDVDESTSQSGYAQCSADWGLQPKLPTQKPAPEQRSLGDDYKDKASPSKAKLVPYSSSSSSIGDHNSPSADRKASLASLYNMGLNPVPEEGKPEKDVDYVARLFMEVIMDGIMAAASSAKGSNPKRWRIRSEIGYKNSEEFKVNGYTINAHPDCRISVRVEDLQISRPRDVFLHLEVKKLQHSLSPHQIFGQELSELLAEAMRGKDHKRKDLDTIPSWLISWHHLECYFTKLEVTRDYLAQLSDTSGLYKQEPPLLRRSRRYNLRIPTDRVEVGLTYARILLELLGEYNSTQKLGVVEQLQS